MNNQEQNRLREEFVSLYGRPAAVVSRAPGRLEILGNHTDYNEGVVLSVAVDREACFAAAPSGAENTDECRIHDLRNNSSRTFKLSELGAPSPGDWTNYIKGVIVAFQKRGIQIPAFDAALLSTVPLSAGMSSSAALEMAVAFTFRKLTAANLDWIDLARIGQEAENNYVGARTGLLDQFSSINGKAGQLVFSDFRSLTVSNVPIPAGTALVVANSMVKHNLANEYNERRQRCEEAVALLSERIEGVKALRDVNMQQLDQFKSELSCMAYRRAKHVVGENERVFAGIDNLRNNKLADFGTLLFASHESSRTNFDNSCPELDALIEIGKCLPGAIGARLSGGGFGGISVHLVHEAEAHDYAKRLSTAFQTRFNVKSDVMICHAADGAEVL